MVGPKTCLWLGYTGDEFASQEGGGDGVLLQHVTCHTLGFRYPISGKRPEVVLQTGGRYAA